MKSIMDIAGNQIKKRRKELGMTQTTLACKTGFHQNYISEVEHGRRNITIGVLAIFADALNVDYDYILKS